MKSKPSGVSPPLPPPGSAAEPPPAPPARDRLGELGGVEEGRAPRWGAMEVLNSRPSLPCGGSRPWLWWWYMAAEMPLSCRRRTSPREVLVVRVASL